MPFTQRTSILVFFLFLLASCSVYKSTGRKNFEGKASQNNVRASENPAIATDLEATCWDQPVNEPLWNLVDSPDLHVTKINEEEIQVCALPPPY